MRTPLSISLFLAIAVVALARPAAAAETRPDAAAAELVARMEQAMGGSEALAGVGILEFDFVAERDGKERGRWKHRWNRSTGDYRLEGTDREGHARRAEFNVGTRKGRAWLDGAELAGEPLAKGLEAAYGRFINDTYWLLMPWKLRDPGAHIELAQAGSGGKPHVLKLSFDSGVGLTPGDVYWVHVDPETLRVGAWEMLLQGEKPPADKVLWEGWTKVGPIWLSLVKRAPDNSFAIKFENVAAR